MLVAKLQVIQRMVSIDWCKQNWGHLGFILNLNQKSQVQGWWQDGVPPLALGGLTTGPDLQTLFTKPGIWQTCCMLGGWAGLAANLHVYLQGCLNLLEKVLPGIKAIQ